MISSRTRQRARGAAARKRAMVQGYIEPCLVTLAPEPPTGEGWGHEIKYDGFRSQAHVCNGKVIIYSKNGHDWTERYTAIAREAAALDNAVLDGEMVVLRRDGTCDFWQLQSDVRAGNSQRLAFVCFDLLFHKGRDIRSADLIERKDALQRLLGKVPRGRLIFSEHLEINGKDMLALAHKHNVEGVVSKRLNSKYRAAKDTGWIKTPCRYQEELFVAGVASDDGAFGGLYLARRRDGQFIYAGLVEDGFSPESISDILARLKPFAVRDAPVETASEKPAALWVEPFLKVDIAHRGGLKADRVRRAVFERVIERAPPLTVKSMLQAAMPVTLRDNIMRELPDAVVPSQAELKAHWRRVAKEALPDLARRPLTLVRHIDGTTFYHKGPFPKLPKAVRSIEITKADGDRGVRLYVESLEGLLGLVDIGVVEVHPWPCTVDHVGQPDLMIFDLDPGSGISWTFTRDTALALRDSLARQGFDSRPKLTGGSGLHVMVPIGRALSQKDVHTCALALAEEFAARNPKKYTTLAGARNRVGKLFIDHLRNGRGASAVGCFSPRARPGLPYARPTTWLELERSAQPPLHGIVRKR